MLGKLIIAIDSHNCNYPYFSFSPCSSLFLRCDPLYFELHSTLTTMCIRCLLSSPLLPSARLYRDWRRYKVGPRINLYDHEALIFSSQDVALLARLLHALRFRRHARLAHSQVPSDNVGLLGSDDDRLRSHDSVGRSIEHVCISISNLPGCPTNILCRAERALFPLVAALGIGSLFQVTVPTIN